MFDAEGGVWSVSMSNEGRSISHSERKKEACAHGMCVVLGVRAEAFTVCG